MKGVYHPAAIVSAIAFFVWGWAWYGLLFGNAWLAAMGKTMSQMNNKDPLPYIVSIVVSLLIGYGTAIALSHGENQSARHGIEFAIFFGVVFIASTMLQENTYAGRPVSLWLINAGFVVTGMIICGIINGAWRPRAKAAA